MKRWLTLVGSVVLAAALTAGAASGGPDSGGYIWKDNVESGGPAVSFVDITAESDIRPNLNLNDLSQLSSTHTYGGIA